MIRSFVVGAVVAVSFVSAAQSATLSIGNDVFADTGSTPTIAARFKDFSQRDAGKFGEMYLGEPDLGNAANRNEVGNIPYKTSSSLNFSFGFNSLTNQLESSIGSKSLTYDFTPTDDWNAAVIRVRNTQSIESFSLTNLFVNGESVSDIVVDPGDNLNLSITDFAVLADFNVTGTLNLTPGNNLYGKGERSKFEILGGNAVSAVPVPAALPLLLTALAGFGVLSVRKKRLLEG